MLNKFSLCLDDGWYVVWCCHRCCSPCLLPKRRILNMNKMPWSVFHANYLYAKILFIMVTRVNYVK